MQDLRAILCCPRCLNAFSPNVGEDDRWFCSDKNCLYASTGFPVVDGRPVLIDFERSIFSGEAFAAQNGNSVLPREEKPSLKSRIKAFLLGSNKVAERHQELIAAEMKKLSPRPRLLMVGGGTIGSGIRALYDQAQVEIVGTDVYVSPHTQVVADGHQLPFVTASFDGVWIQAVLEHVLNPAEVVAEIYRVLKPNGVVYADTPFMQQVHEHAYDFTRFTLSGHRWLFRRFRLLGAGVVSGAGSATIWSIRYLVRAISGSDKLATGMSLMFFWLRFFDYMAKPGVGADAACGVYFFGRKSEHTIDARSIVRFYDENAGQLSAPEFALRTPNIVGATERANTFTLLKSK
jgi:ubiquinone/menaquinone biosynthesis C-methylase UbiE